MLAAFSILICEDAPTTHSGVLSIFVNQKTRAGRVRLVTCLRRPSIGVVLTVEHAYSHETIMVLANGLERIIVRKFVQMDTIIR